MQAGLWRGDRCQGGKQRHKACGWLATRVNTWPGRQGRGTMPPTAKAEARAKAGRQQEELASGKQVLVAEAEPNLEAVAETPQREVSSGKRVSSGRLLPTQPYV